MSFAAPVASTFLSRLFRPFSTSSPILSVTPESQARKMSTTTEKATLAAGCFWGVEHLFRKHFGSGKGLLDAKVGYCGGKTSSPSYRAVCGGDTGRKFYSEARRLSTRYGPHTKTLLTFLSCSCRRRSSPNLLRSLRCELPPACRVLLPYARRDDNEPPGP